MENDRRIRKQIYLDPGQNSQVKQLAARNDKSEAEIIREAIDSYLISNRTNPEDPLFELVGMVRDGVKNGSTTHDRDIYLSKKGDTDEEG
ncbi:hypothetical protein GCM10007063_33880 [Lentibacillus kapialis]|uniref:Ribbon-helix-helix protein CopG domain-containing protein n=1 Tax=Lentibacillus kapialis TaxID=340214 RepID=A0A917Q304_9BACI|nr:CopG family transcriptional regulator [Lentibacillus kapialis]GGK08684.1 hypothetical protein GCM10007063_33880 [Lentibacillus kapialis]